MRSKLLYDLQPIENTNVLQDTLLRIPALVALVVAVAAVGYLGWFFRAELLYYFKHTVPVGSVSVLLAIVLGVVSIAVLVLFTVIVIMPVEPPFVVDVTAEATELPPETGTPEPTVSVEQTPEATAKAEQTQQTAFFCTGQVNPNLDANVSLRSGPGLGHPREDRIAPGVQVVMIGFSAPDADGYYWMQVTFNNQVLYVRSDFLVWEDCPALQGFAPRMAVTPTPAPATTPDVIEPTALPNEDGQQVDPDVPAPRVTEAATSSPAPTAIEETTTTPEPTVTQDPTPSPEAIETDVLGVVVEITHPSNGATIHPGESTRFEAKAFDARIGNANGTGIVRVDFEIWAPNGQLVVGTDEFIVKYCANGGDDQCHKTDEIFTYEPGQFRIRAQATASDGTTSGWVEHSFFVSDQAVETPEVIVEVTAEVTPEATAESTEVTPEATAESTEVTPEATAESTEAISIVSEPTAEATPEVTDAPVETGGIPVELPPTPIAQPTKTVTVMPTPDVALTEATEETAAPSTPEDAPPAEITEAAEVEREPTPLITPTETPVEPPPDATSAAAAPQPGESEEPVGEPSENQPPEAEESDVGEAAVPPAEEPAAAENVPQDNSAEGSSAAVTNTP